MYASGVSVPVSTIFLLGFKPVPTLSVYVLFVTHKTFDSFTLLHNTFDSNTIPHTIYNTMIILHGFYYY